ncbi:PTS glucitol/sorbitol transporter subunit IIC, partial [Brachyspira catarrhinii]
LRFATKYTITRYTIIPVLAVLFLGNPMCYTFGRFVEEKYKPAYYDATVSFLHPVTGLFPHANGGELFVYMGIATGITNLKLPLGDLAVRYFIVGVIVILIRGIITEKIYAFLTKK